MKYQCCMSDRGELWMWWLLAGMLLWQSSCNVCLRTCWGEVDGQGRPWWTAVCWVASKVSVVLCRESKNQPTRQQKRDWYKWFPTSCCTCGMLLWATSGNDPLISVLFTAWMLVFQFSQVFCNPQPYQSAQQNTRKLLSLPLIPEVCQRLLWSCRWFTPTHCSELSTGSLYSPSCL